MKQRALSIEQMQNLQKLGLDTSDASMGWYGNSLTALSLEEYLKLYDTNEYGSYQPAYTLQDILERLDDELTRNSCGESEYYTVETFLGVVELNDKKQNLVKLFGENNILNNAYNMLVWCIENGYIKTNKI